MPAPTLVINSECCNIQFSGTASQVPLNLMEVKDTSPSDELGAYQCKLRAGHELMFSHNLLSDSAEGVTVWLQINPNVQTLEK